MEGNANEADIDSAATTNEFKPARFHTDLRLPASDEQLLKDAATAIRQEYRECSTWKRLSCRKVSIRGSVSVWPR